MKRSLLLLLLALLLSCSPQKDAGGTASEGESFVYGFVIDSTENSVALLKETHASASGSLVVLSQLSYTAEGLVSSWSDSAYTDSLGYYQFKTPPAGIYTILAQGSKPIAAIHASFEVPDSGLNLGYLGMYRPIQVSGAFDGAPSCAGGLKVSMPGIPGFATMNSETSFTLSQAPPGHSLLLVQCGDTVQQWHIVLPGSCPTVSLDSIAWTTKAGSGSGLQGIQGTAWSWQMGPPLVVNEKCRLVRNGNASEKK